jgi:hypothetical protein
MLNQCCSEGTKGILSSRVASTRIFSTSSLFQRATEPIVSDGDVASGRQSASEGRARDRADLVWRGMMTPEQARQAETGLDEQRTRAQRGRDAPDQLDWLQGRTLARSDPYQDRLDMPGVEAESQQFSD